MTHETKDYIKELAQELALASHQSKDKELSGLYTETRNAIVSIEKNLLSLTHNYNRVTEILEEQKEMIKESKQAIKVIDEAQDKITKRQDAINIIFSTTIFILGGAWTVVTFILK